MYKTYEILLAMGAAWAISGIIQLLMKTEKKDHDSRFAIAVITVFLLSIMDNLLRPTFIPIAILKFIYPVTRPSYLLVGPILLIYVRILLKKNFKIKLLHLLHLIPFILFIAYILYDPGSIHPKIIVGEGSSEIMNDVNLPKWKLSQLWDLVIHFSRFSYCFIILIILYKHRKNLSDMVSIFHNQNTLSWLKNLIILYVVIYFLAYLSFFLFKENSVFYLGYSAFTRNIPPILFVFFFSLYSQRQYIISDIGIPPNDGNRGKYSKSGTSEKENSETFQKIQYYVRSSELYLDPELTLNELARQMGETRHKLSEAINRGSGEKFYSFINKIRLDEFLKAVKTDRYPHYTILSIAYECGFGSSSAFYKLFKKEYDMTPRQYLKKNCPQKESSAEFSKEE